MTDCSSPRTSAALPEVIPGMYSEAEEAFVTSNWARDRTRMRATARRSRRVLKTTRSQDKILKTRMTMIAISDGSPKLF